MTKPNIEKFAIVCGIPSDELKSTVDAQYFDGWTVIEQNYTGDDLWELILVKEGLPENHEHSQ